MAKRVGSRKKDDESALTRTVNSVFSFFRFAEFEILFVLFFVIAFIIFKDLPFQGSPTSFPSLSTSCICCMCGDLQGIIGIKLSDVAAGI
ncbi:uncharacterized protein LOC133723878 [Rosa rugosa]|uniref:uncharacterized protein LOC133723878 n=1 Tax=Rosa rugosa TaxID=74645 RepID=UPI002B4091B4|nr:uncharacterized protein LOC133723878 [Rosa rugosa]